MTQPSPAFAQFDAKAQVFDEVIEQPMVAGLVLPPHGHPFALNALVVEGEMWLSVGADTLHLRDGQTLKRPRGRRHERYGAEGAVVWVARRHAR